MSRSIKRLFQAQDLSTGVSLRVYVTGLSEASFMRAYVIYALSNNRNAFARVTFAGAEILNGETLEVIFTFDRVIG